MRRPINIQLSPGEQAAYASWSRRTLGICAIVIASVIAFPMIQRAVSGDVGAYAQERPREPTCAGWDEAASDAIAHLVQGKRDVDLRLVGDAVFRMRRARRNCHMGWINLACLDYQAVIGGSPGLRDNSLMSSPQCASGEPSRVIGFGDPAR